VERGLPLTLVAMTKLSTDREILERIYTDYASAFHKVKHAEDNGSADSKIYVPIDIPAIAKLLENDPHVLFGRLYYHLDHKYRYKQDNGALVHLFAFKVGEKPHCINYPYLAAILSEHNEQHSSRQKNFWMAVAALVLSLAAILAQIA